MRIVFVHERYQQAGGEDPIFAAESDLMEEFGHSVVGTPTTTRGWPT